MDDENVIVITDKCVDFTITNNTFETSRPLEDKDAIEGTRTNRWELLGPDLCHFRHVIRIRRRLHCRGEHNLRL